MKPRRRLKKSVKRTLGALGLLVIILIFVRIHHNATAEADANVNTPQQTQSTSKTTKKQAKKQAKPQTKTEAKQVLQDNWQTILDESDADVPVSIAVYSKRFDETIELNTNKTTAHTTASIVKVAILAQLLHNHQTAGTKLTAAERDSAVLAIENSDNDAATALYTNMGGSTQLNSLFQTLGMSHSLASASGWVNTTTTAVDQLKLLNMIFYNSNNYLSSASRAYIQNLMGHVASNENWGISAGDKTYQLKNGWRQNTDGTWMVNSIGHLGTGTHSATIAILTDDNKNLKSGEKLVEKLAKAVGATLVFKA